jgi:hypothetical protein
VKRFGKRKPRLCGQGFFSSYENVISFGDEYTKKNPWALHQGSVMGKVSVF